MGAALSEVQRAGVAPLEVSPNTPPPEKVPIADLQSPRQDFIDIQDPLIQSRTHSDPMVRSRPPGGRNAPRALARQVSPWVASEIRRYFSEELSTHLHGSCPNCHHWHNHVEYTLRPRQHNRIVCQNVNCGHVIFGLGGNSSHESLMSQMTITTTNAQGQDPVPCVDGDTYLTAATLTISPRTTGLGTLSESEAENPPAIETTHQRSQVVDTNENTDQEATSSSALKAQEPSTPQQPRERAIRNPIEIVHHRQRLNSVRYRIKRWKSRLLFRLQKNKFPPSSNLADAREHGESLHAVRPSNVSSKVQSPGQTNPKANRAALEVPQTDDQTHKLSSAATLNGSSGTSRTNTLDRRGKERPVLEQSQQALISPPELSPDEEKSSNREAKRRKMTNEANKRRCKCTDACHCRPPSRHDASELVNATGDNFHDLLFQNFGLGSTYGSRGHTGESTMSMISFSSARETRRSDYSDNVMESNQAKDILTQSRQSTESLVATDPPGLSDSRSTITSSSATQFSRGDSDIDDNAPPTRLHSLTQTDGARTPTLEDH